MATHSSVLAWRIPGTGRPGGLPSMGSDTTEATQQQQLSMFTFPFISCGFSSSHSSSFSSSPLPLPAFHCISSLSHLLHHRQEQKNHHPSFALFILQGVDQILPFPSFYITRHLKVFYPITYSLSLILSVFLFSLRVLQFFCHGSSVTTCVFLFCSASF